METINLLNKLYSDIDDSIEKYNLFDNRVYIWGVSRASYAALQYYAHKGVSINAIVDNNEKLAGKLPDRFHGYCEWENDIPCRPKVISGKSLKNKIASTDYVLVFSRFYHDIKAQLLEYGADENKVILIYDSSSELGYIDNLIKNNSLSRAIDIHELKKIELEILNEFVKLCHEYGLNYYLAAGSLLGAVRHKGFIPWDDDIDVYMPVPDYYKLLEIAQKNGMINNQYCIMYHGLVENYSWRFMKMVRQDTITYSIRWPLICSIGVNIDIFPVSGCPKGKIDMDKYYVDVLSVLDDWYKDYVKINNKQTIKKEWADKVKDVISRYDYYSAPRVGMLLDGDYKREVIDGPLGRNYIDLEFEGYKFKGIENYDEYLRASYGEYMTPPPEKYQKIGTHELKAYYINR